MIPFSDPFPSSASACGTPLHGFRASFSPFLQKETIVNTTLNASHTSKHAPPVAGQQNNRPTVEFPREEELRRLSLTDRITLRLALRVLRRAQRSELLAERQKRRDQALRLRAEYERRRLDAVRPMQML